MFFYLDLGETLIMHMTLTENIILWVIWLAYIAYSLIRGLKREKYNIWPILFMIAFSLWGVYEEYSFGPMDTTVECTLLL